jgi:hypothetical protein
MNFSGFFSLKIRLNKMVDVATSKFKRLKSFFSRFEEKYGANPTMLQ